MLDSNSPAQAQSNFPWPSPACWLDEADPIEVLSERIAMNNLVYLVGLVVIILFILSFFGFR